MKILPFSEVVAAPRAISDIAQVLRDDGVVCFPVRGSYRLVANVASEAAVNRLLQSKRRTSNHPALILVPNLANAKSIVKGTEWRTTKRAADRLWPKPVTLVLDPSNDMPAKIKKTLTKATGKLGVRVPDDPLALAVLAEFGGPLLFSSANIENKPGATSAAAIRQRFLGKIDLWVDGGDTKPEPPSTLVELTDTAWHVTREGAVTKADVDKAMKAA